MCHPSKGLLSDCYSVVDCTKVHILAANKDSESLSDNLIAIVLGLNVDTMAPLTKGTRYTVISYLSLFIHCS